jgi:hypothetical protein
MPPGPHVVRPQKEPRGQFALVTHGRGIWSQDGGAVPTKQWMIAGSSARKAPQPQPAGQGRNGENEQVRLQPVFARQLLPAGQVQLTFCRQLFWIVPQRLPQKVAAGFGLQACLLRLWARA